jgi:hypothetical protein
VSLMPEYRAQLYRAAQQHAGRRRHAPGAGWPVGVSAAVAVAVALVAVMALHHRHPAVPTTDRVTSSTTSSTAQPSPEISPPQLLSTLGVLRRPQTEADRQAWIPGFFRTFASGGCREANTPLQCTLRLDRGLIREVVVPGSGYQVGLLPYTGAGATVGVAVTLQGPGIDYAAAGPWSDSTTFPPGLSALRSRGLLLSAYVSDGVDRGVIVVPDGVARVVIGPVHLSDTSLGARVTPTPGASAAVHDNVALFQLNGLSVKGLGLKAAQLGPFFSQGSGSRCQINFAIYALPASATLAWFGPGGRLVNHVRIAFRVFVGTHHPAPGATVRDPSCGATGNR